MEWDVMDVSSSGWGGRSEREEARGAESDNFAEWGQFCPFVQRFHLVLIRVQPVCVSACSLAVRLRALHHPKL